VRLRLIIVAVFASAAAVPGLIAYSTGLLPGPTTASADVAKVASPEFRVTSLAWPQRAALGLAATDTQIIWEQRGRGKDVAGIWAYDVRTQRPFHLLGRSSTGNGAGHPSASASTVVWAAWAGPRGSGAPRVEAYDDSTARRWTVAQTGRDPSIAGDTVVWVDRGGGATPADDAVAGVDVVTDEGLSIPVVGRVRDVAVWGSWVAWVSGSGDTAGVWAGSQRDTLRYQLATAATAVGIDRERVVWAAKSGRHSTSIVSWNRRSSHSKVLCRIRGTAASLSLGRHFVVWVTTTKAGSAVWAYDFKRGRAYPVSEHAGMQVSPVLADGTVFWADRRSGQWELYGRVLQP
jgi:hypothetical protein